MRKLGFPASVIVPSALAALLLNAHGIAHGSDGMDQMREPMPDKVPTAPPVKGFAEGQDIFFIHTEASDTDVAKVLTDMMGSPVLVVPSLSLAPEGMLASVYVFKNGVKGMGPFGFQPDIFDKPPGQQGYTPLRSIKFVRWRDERSARVLKSAKEVIASQGAGQLSIEQSGAVVNMPMLTWPGGRR